MRLFAPNKELEVQTFTLKLINNNCPELKGLMEGPRAESRVNLTVVVLVVPLHQDRLLADRAFAAVTKEFTTLGVSLVLSQPRALEEVILGFRGEGGMRYVRARARHLHPMGAGFYQLGLQLKEMVHPADYPGLESIVF
ncbi:MAG: hypothetical protein ACUVUC_00125 [Thermoguttaceae bacterium]